MAWPLPDNDDSLGQYDSPEPTHDTCEEKVSPDCTAIATEIRSDGLGYTTYLCSSCAQAWDRIIKPHPVKASA